MKVSVPTPLGPVEVEPTKSDGIFPALKKLLRASKSTLVVATDAHYEKAAELVSDAKKEIVLCQRTSTFLLAPERGRPNETKFSNALNSKLMAGIPIYHMIHEESCIADIWRLPSKFNLELGGFPRQDNFFVGRYVSDKPVPRLLIVDQETIGVVFDIDQMQFYSVVESKHVKFAAEFTKRYITDRGQDGFSARQFYERLRAAREVVEQIQQKVDASDPNVFSHLLLLELQKLTTEAPVLDYPLSNSDGSILTRIHLAWPKKKLAVFLDSPTVREQELERERIWNQFNLAVQGGWRCLFFSRSRLLSALDSCIKNIADFSR